MALRGPGALLGACRSLRRPEAARSLRWLHAPSSCPLPTPLPTPSVPSPAVEEARAVVEKLTPEQLSELALSLDKEVRRRLFIASAAPDFGTSHDSSMVDTNEDGRISKSELVGWMRHSVSAAISRAEGAPDAGAEAAVAAPSRRQLMLFGLSLGVPYIGFGMVDNSIMLLAGQAIDACISDVLNFGPLTSAALGNIAAAWASLLFSNFLTHLFDHLGLSGRHGISSAQHRLRAVRLAGFAGSFLGITLGLFLGMFPIVIFGDGDEDENHGQPHAA